ncbi:MAG: ferredoxin--NADP reductase [Mucilaginibacter sp.]|uniref:ferredoxin--NADP reductase n=1 Tax=Mucilaginibacter sp. TaxID=1882438 RepID=UPI003263F088
MKHYTLKVLELRAETADTVTVVFKQPGLKKISYIAGQYLTLIFRINGRKYIRPYSFSSAPLVDTTLEVTIKRVPGGIVSNHIIDKLKVDDVVEVMQPMGDFTLQNTFINTNSHLVLWGAGSGITPLMSLAKYALHQGLVSHVTLVYGNRNTEAVIFSDKITVLQNQHKEHFSAWHFYTQPAIAINNPYVVQGRIDPARVLSVMKAEGDLNATVHYICGPEGLKESVKTALNDLKIDNDKIFSEEFEIVRNPEEFGDVVTSAVAIKKNGENITIEVVKGKSILEAGLDALLDLDYSCQTGSCLVCRGTLLKGQIKMIGLQSRPPELLENECLLCCSFPLTNAIEIAI